MATCSNANIAFYTSYYGWRQVHSDTFPLYLLYYGNLKLGTSYYLLEVVFAFRYLAVCHSDA